VPDGDTGTNLFLTFEAAVGALADAEADLRATVGAIAHGALLGARGNSGIILSQLVRGFGEALAAAEDQAQHHQAAVTDAFRRASDSAYAAVAEPKEGTVLSVARAAADAVASLGPGTSLAGLVTAAADAAAEALARTPDQLEVLARAGVVDAGGRGLVVLFDALVEAVTGEHRDQPPTALPVPQDVHDSAVEDGGAYEVMYLLDADDAAVPGLREALAALGDSLVVVGGGGLWNVHVHTDDVGGAVEAGIAAGRPHRIRVTHLLHDTAVRRSVQRPEGRAVIAVAHGPGTAGLLDASGARVVRAHGNVAPSTAEILDVLRSCPEPEIVLLPSDGDVRPVAEAAAEVARREGRRVSVVPTRSIVQTLAAVAVHEPAATFEDDVVGMTRAAGATRYGGVSVAVKDAVTSAGLCRTGDVLGIVGGDVVEIGQSLDDVACAVLERLLATGGELVTLVRGSDGDDALAASVSARVRRAHAGTEVVVYEGGQPYWPLILGVE
jgi:DAK2 domain fusion protein YloV